jgi:hypothetical protein
MVRGRVGDLVVVARKKVAGNEGIGRRKLLENPKTRGEK